MVQELQRRRQLQPVTIENAQLIFKNFTGREGQFNEEGVRSVGCILPDDIAEVMKEDGWNVKYLKPREEGDLPKPWVPIAVSYRNRPPRVVLIAKRINQVTQELEQVRTAIGEDLVQMLDFADMANVDLIINPFQWGPNNRGETGVKAYLKSIYVTIRMDALEEKYAAIPEVDMNGKMLAIEAGPGDDIIEGEILEDDFQE